MALLIGECCWNVNNIGKSASILEGIDGLERTWRAFEKSFPFLFAISKQVFWKMIVADEKDKLRICLGLVWFQPFHQVLDLEKRFKQKIASSAIRIKKDSLTDKALSLILEWDFQIKIKSLSFNNMNEVCQFCWLRHF